MATREIKAKTNFTKSPINVTRKKKSYKKTIFSFFAGAGFLDLGFEAAGFKVEFVNEIYKPFLDAYKFSRKSMKMSQKGCHYSLGDMEKLTAGSGKKELSGLVNKATHSGELIGFIGGPPCPDFSAGGKNLGRNGRHGRLSEIYVKLILQQKPDFFLFENVKGLWKTQAHREFYEELKGRLQKHGYVTAEKLINAIEYGAPQDRYRIIMVGFKKGLVPSNLLNTKNRKEIAENVFPWDLEKKYSKSAVITNSRQINNPVPSELTVGYWFKKNNVEKHPNAKHYFQPREGLIKFQTIKEGDTSKKSFKRLHRNRYSPTAAYGNNEVHLHPWKPRRITVAEALAVQSLPKKYAFPDQGMSLSDMFKAVGNGVPYMAAKSIGKMINNFLETCGK